MLCSVLVLLLFPVLLEGNPLLLHVHFARDFSLCKPMVTPLFYFVFQLFLPSIYLCNSFSMLLWWSLSSFIYHIFLFYFWGWIKLINLIRVHQCPPVLAFWEMDFIEILERWVEIINLFTLVMLDFHLNKI